MAGAVREHGRGRRGFGLEYKWSALSCTSLGALIATINGGTLIIALPELAKELHAPLFNLVWVILGCMLAQTALVLMVGRFADMIGRKKLYVGGFALFTVVTLSPVSRPAWASSSSPASSWGLQGPS